MQGRFSRFIKTSLLVGDLLALNLAFGLGYLYKFKSFDNLSSDRYLILLMVFNAAWLIVSYFVRAYSENRIIDFDKYFVKVIRLILVHLLVVTAFWVIRKAFYYSREQLMVTYGILLVLVFLWRGGFFFAVKRHRKLGKNLHHVIVAGAGELAEQLLDIFEKNTDYGYSVQGVFDDRIIDHPKYIGPISEVGSFVETHRIEELYCAMSELDSEQIKVLSQLADKNILRLRLIPDVRGIGYKRLNMEFFEHLPILSPLNLPLDEGVNRILKRAFDIVFSTMVIVFVLSWLYPLIALLINLSSKGPVLFRQLRNGQDNREFQCLKFRSMRISDTADTLQVTRGDDRITGIGQFIRRTSIDELPQFFNVFAGQMSVVGPRPHMLRHTEKYSALIQKYMVRHFVKPGITGLAQVKGYRGETIDTRMMEARVRVDRLYVESWSFLLDIWIILRTVIGLFKRDENAY